MVGHKVHELTPTCRHVCVCVSVQVSTEASDDDDGYSDDEDVVGALLTHDSAQSDNFAHELANIREQLDRCVLIVSRAPRLPLQRTHAHTLQCHADAIG